MSIYAVSAGRQGTGWASAFKRMQRVVRTLFNSSGWLGTKLLLLANRNILIVQGFYCRLCTLWIMELMRCFVIGPDVGNISTTINDDQPGIQRESMTACYREMHMDSHVDLKGWSLGPPS
ncbi:hypothetical protein AcW2_000923 [Taiwanofungus camphoratus]|nr:hypothetical protein AcW2_000923 [Antrodia cinnamomea]